MCVLWGFYITFVSLITMIVCRMKKNILLILSVVVVLFACKRNLPSKKISAHRFHTDVMLKTTPVKNQGKSSLCWAYAMLGTIEIEHLMQGDSVNLSVDYMARKYLEHQAQLCFFSKGKTRVSLSGTPAMALDLLCQYGITHYDAYHAPQTNYNMLARRVQQIASRAHRMQTMQRNVSQLLNQEIGYLPNEVVFLHATYTMKAFAHSVCLPDEYLPLTSFTHHPYGKPFVLEIPDNRFLNSFLNLPLDTLMAHIKGAIYTGHPVCWEGDISEPGFSYSDGVAAVPVKHQTVTPQSRQQQFETLKTTDDHCMILVGMAHDKQGKTYFIAKNSWGKTNCFGGYMFLSEAYVRLKTIAVFMSKAAYAGQ